MLRSRLAQSLLATSMFALASHAAAARDIGAVISFGDSLSDNGNLYAATGGTTPTSPPYFQGHYSNGQVFTEYLNGAMQTAGAATLGGVPIDPAANQNYAFGGARTDALTALPPGIPAQIGFFQVQDGVFAANDVVTLLGGANNIFDAARQPAATPTDIAAAAALAAGDIGAAAGTLSQIGAPTLVVLNLPDLGLTPQFNGSPTTQFVGTLASDTFNAALSQAVFASAAANPGTDTHLVDVERVFSAIIADPQRFGFTNATQGCLFVPSCLSASQAEQNQYLFFDNVHPTTAGHQLLASLVLDYLTAGEQAVNVGSMSETAILDRYEGVSAAFERGRNVLEGGTSGFYATVGGNWYDRGEGRMHGYDYDVGTIRLGYDTLIGNGTLLGGSLSYSNGSLDNSPITYDSQAFSADIYAATMVRGFLVGATAGIAHADFNDIERVTLLPGVVNGGADTNAAIYDVGAEIAYPMVFGDLTATPSLSLTYLHFDVDGFTEAGLAARIQYDGYDRDALFGAANLNLAYATEAFGRQARLTGRIGWEDDLTSDDSGIVSRIAGSPSGDSFAAFDDLPGRGFILGAGAEASFTDDVAGSLSYSVGFSDTIDVSHAAKAALTVKF